MEYEDIYAKTLHNQDFKTKAMQSKGSLPVSYKKWLESMKVQGVGLAESDRSGPLL